MTNINLKTFLDNFLNSDLFKEYISNLNDLEKAEEKKANEENQKCQMELEEEITQLEATINSQIKILKTDIEENQKKFNLKIELWNWKEINEKKKNIKELEIELEIKNNKWEKKQRIKINCLKIEELYREIERKIWKEIIIDYLLSKNKCEWENNSIIIKKTKYNEWLEEFEKEAENLKNSLNDSEMQENLRLFSNIVKTFFVDVRRDHFFLKTEKINLDECEENKKFENEPFH